MMLTELDPNDLRDLMNLPAFRRFLYAAIQTAGVLEHSGSANGQHLRDLGYSEGRRGLGLELLKAADLALPEPMQTTEAAHTLLTLLTEATLPKPKGTKNERHSRYDEP